MTEQLLQYIWQLRYFNRHELRTSDGENLTIIFPGNLNRNQGPDFLNAKIKVGDTTWAGSIEIHVNSSQWAEHKHSADPNYDNVILHVVWNNDVSLNLSFPVLELQSRVSGLLLARYEEWMYSKSFIPCENSFRMVEPLTWLFWKERLVVERIQQKTVPIRLMLEQNHHHWEETFWRMLAANFGLKVNGDAFSELAASLPLNLLGRHRENLKQLEALLFGQAGLLEDDHVESYPSELKREYEFLAAKYKLNPVKIPVHFLRMRPNNFPTVRLAQLAMLLHQTDKLFAFCRVAGSPVQVLKVLQVGTSFYWEDHFVFGQRSASIPKTLGSTMANFILINTVIPMLFLYGQYHGVQSIKDKSLEWLAMLKPETNVIINGYTKLGMVNSNAADSQALLHLKKHYCDQRRCIECALGNSLLKNPMPNGS